VGRPVTFMKSSRPSAKTTGTSHFSLATNPGTKVSSSSVLDSVKDQICVAGVVFRDLHELRLQFAAGSAPRGPETQRDDLAFERRERRGEPSNCRSTKLNESFALYFAPAGSS